MLLTGWSTAARAQEPDVTFQPVLGIPVAPEPKAAPGPRPDVPQPPRSLLYRAPPHGHPVVPPGPENGLPQPASPPTAVALPALPGGAGPDTGQFRFFQLEKARPPGIIPSPGTPEPSCGVIGDTVLQAGNWYAALSRDNGSSWTHLNPYTFFPALAAGFCCDQQVIDVPSHGIVVWLLQYVSTTSGENAYRVAVANGRDALRSGDPNRWTSYTFTPQNNFGYQKGYWFDYPDISYDSGWVYLRANAIGGANPSAVVWRMNLNDLAAGGTLGYQFLRSESIGGWGHRLAKGGSTMAFAAYKSITEMYVWTWPAGSTAPATRSTQPIAVWSNGPISVRGPDRRDWAGSWPNVGAIVGAFGNGTEAGFMWGCSPQSGRPMPYVRVARFRLSDRQKIAEHDIWSSTNAYLYPDAASNSRGDVGGVLACGSSTKYVTVGNFLIDQYDAWPPDTLWLQANGNSGPNENRFGDFFTVRRHPVFPRTFVSDGSHQDGGPDAAQAQPMFAWFGRDDDEPTWVQLDVRVAGGVTTASMALDVTDMDGLKNGSAPFTRRFTPGQGYELTAPITVSSVFGLTYVFDHWTFASPATTRPTSLPVGERTLAVGSIGSSDDAAVAYYTRSRTLTVQSQNPSSGVTITVSPADYLRLGDGSTAFTRKYRDGEIVTLTAPAAIGFDQFKSWREGAVLAPPGQRTVSYPMTADRTVVAEYWDNVPGTVGPLGTGCIGQNGKVPVHSITWPGGRLQQGPQQGSPTDYELCCARGQASAVLFLGLSSTTFNGVPLPLPLGLIGMDGCTLFHDLVADVPVATRQSGQATVRITWPVNAAAIGGHVYSSFSIIDPGAPRTLPITMSNALDMVQGGNR